MTSYALDERPKPLFDSGEQIGPGQTAEVAGVDRPLPGRYEFYRATHGDFMYDALEVF